VGEAVFHHAVHGDGDVVGVGVDHPLRTAGGAGGVDKRRDRVTIGDRARLAPVLGLLGEGVEVPVALGDIGVVVGAADQVVNRAGLGGDFQRVLGEVAAVDQHAGTAVLDDEGRFARAQAVVERHRDGAKDLASEIGRHRVLGGGYVEGDPIAGAHAEVGERLGEATDAAEPFRVGPAAVTKDQRCVVGIAFDRGFEDAGDMHGAVPFRGWA
jgi:hypothetical protein